MPMEMPDEMRRALDAAGGEARRMAAQLMTLVDNDPEGGAAPSVGRCEVLYVAAAQGTNLTNGVVQHALRVRPRAELHTVDGTHFDFLSLSAHEVAQIVNEFLLGATALLG